MRLVGQHTSTVECNCGEAELCHTETIPQRCIVRFVALDFVTVLNFACNLFTHKANLT